MSVYTVVPTVKDIPAFLMSGSPAPVRNESSLALLKAFFFRGCLEEHRPPFLSDRCWQSVKRKNLDYFRAQVCALAALVGASILLRKKETLVPLLLVGFSSIILGNNFHTSSSRLLNAGSLEAFKEDVKASLEASSIKIEDIEADRKGAIRLRIFQLYWFFEENLQTSAGKAAAKVFSQFVTSLVDARNKGVDIQNQKRFDDFQPVGKLILACLNSRTTHPQLKRL